MIEAVDVETTGVIADEIEDVPHHQRMEGAADHIGQRSHLATAQFDAADVVDPAIVAAEQQRAPVGREARVVLNGRTVGQAPPLPVRQIEQTDIPPLPLAPQGSGDTPAVG